MGRIFLYRFLILFLLPKLHHSATQAVINHFHVILWTLKWFWEVWSDFWEVWSDFGKFEVILGNLPNLWNVLASSIGKSLTRASKAPTRLSLHEILVTPQNFVGFCRHWYLLQILFFAAVAVHNNDNQWWKWIKVDFCRPHLQPLPCNLHPSPQNWKYFFGNIFCHLKIGNIFLEIILSSQNSKYFLSKNLILGPSSV